MLKWLKKWFSRSSVEGELQLRIKDQAYGFRPCVYDDDNLVWMGTDYHKTECDAIACAEKYFCKSWSLVK